MTTDRVSQGRQAARLDAGQKVTGTARYTADLALPGTLWVSVVRSPHPHALVRSIDTSPAERVPGVVTVLRAGDARRTDGERITWYEEGVPFLPDPEAAPAQALVRYVGDEITAVAAIDRRAAEDGAAAVVVDYEVLPHVSCLTETLASDAPRIHPKGNEVGEDLIIERSEAPQDDPRTIAGQTAEGVVVERVYRTPIAVHNALEPHATAAWWQADQLTLHTSTQAVNDVRQIMADRLGLAHSQVRVVSEHIGGGFGAKQVPWKSAMIAALLSRKTGRPVQVIPDRRSENLAHGKRHATVQRVRLEASTDGILRSIRAELVADIGAYVIGGEASSLAGPYLELYACPDVHTTSRRVYTNTGPAVAFRAPGYVEATFALESAMDELADRLAIDPIELRLRNYTERDQQKDRPWSSPGALRRCNERVVDAAEWQTTATSGRRPHRTTARHAAASWWAGGSQLTPGAAGRPSRRVRPGSS